MTRADRQRHVRDVLLPHWEQGIREAERRLERETDPRDAALTREGIRLLRVEVKRFRDELRGMQEEFWRMSQ